MIIASIIIFILAAVLGIVLIMYILNNKNTPKGLAMIHGSIAAVGILLLIIMLFVYPTKPYLSLSLFILAALGGFVMMYRDITGKPLPKWLPLGHGIVALIAFVLLLVFAYTAMT